MTYLAASAVPELLVQSDLSALARTLVAKETAPFVLVTLGKDGRSPVVAPFQTREELEEMSDALNSNRGDRSYYASFERAENGRYGRFDERYFEISFTGIMSQIKQLAPWILGGGALIAGAVYFSKARKTPTRKRAPRRRSSPSYRRRTTTVWR